MGIVGKGGLYLYFLLTTKMKLKTRTRGGVTTPVGSIGRIISGALSDLGITHSTHPISNSDQGKSGPILFLIKGSAVHANALNGKGGNR